MIRNWERLAKENSEKAKSYDELQEASKTELQKAKEAAAKAEKEVEALKADAELRELRRKIAKKAGIPENLVFGADEDEMEDVHTVDGIVGLRVGCRRRGVPVGADVFDNL